MKANSRRRVLISSVAMLLVALVALSTSTYAWFSTKTTANAENVHVATSQASSLVLSLDQQTWASTIDLGLTGTVEPASTADLTNWFKATSTGYDEGTVDTTTIEAAAQNTNYLAKTFYIKSIGQEMTVNWNLLLDSNNNTTAMSFARVALTCDGASKIWWSNDGTSTNALTSATGATSAVTSKTDVSGSLATLEADKVYTLVIYTWYEGQDAQCIDTNAGNAIDFDLQFSKAA